MIVSVEDPGKFEDFRYNLQLVAPGKSDGKKTVSRGFIRLEVNAFTGASTLEGVATDDILSIHTSLSVVNTSTTGREIVWMLPEALKAAPLVDSCDGTWMVILDGHADYDERFDRMFWEEHVQDSILTGDVKRVPELGFVLNPDRFAKLGLLRPRGKPFAFSHVEWADRSILRWSADAVSGVYTYGRLES
jgi:hypothetical protein